MWHFFILNTDLLQGGGNAPRNTRTEYRMSTLSAFRFCKLGNRTIAAGNRATTWLYNPCAKTEQITKNWQLQ